MFSRQNIAIILWKVAQKFKIHNNEPTKSNTTVVESTFLSPTALKVARVAIFRAICRATVCSISGDGGWLIDELRVKLAGRVGWLAGFFACLSVTRPTQSVDNLSIPVGELPYVGSPTWPTMAVAHPVRAVLRPSRCDVLLAIRHTSRVKRRGR